jgi:hypothetical protein
LTTGTPRHTWVDNATAITAVKLNELEQDVADALATANANTGGGGGAGVINVKDSAYGAVGDGTTDDTTALDNARAAAVTAGKPLYIPKGRYKRTTPWDLRYDNLHVFGDGRTVSVIVQATSNVAGVRLGRYLQHAHDFGVEYTSAQSSSNTSANAFEFYKACWGKYERLRAYNAARSFYIPQVNYDLGAGDNGLNNWMFSCEVASIIASIYSIGGFKMDSYSATSTGNTYTNIYISNGSTGVTQGASAESPLSWKNQTEMHVSQINVEHVTVASSPLIELISCHAPKFDSVHLEGVRLQGFDTSLFRLYDDVRLNLDNMVVSYSWIESTGGGTKAMFQAADHCHLHVRGVSTTGNTVTATTYVGAHLDSGANNGDVYLINAELGDCTAATKTYTGNEARVRQVNRDITGSGGGTTTPYSAQLFANYSTATAISSFTVEDLDLSGTTYNVNLDVTTNPEAITIPTGAGGKYLANVLLHYKAGSAGGRDAMVKVNGTSQGQAGGYGSGDNRFAPSFVLTLAAGDVVTLATYVTSSGVTVESYSGADISLTLTKIA